MKREIVLAHEFVEYIPEVITERKLYISIPYATAIHKCGCGCGREVVTPLAPTGWQVTFDGKVVSLYPSIGSWNLPCQSHYYIKKGRIAWVPRWTKEIVKGMIQEARAKDMYLCDHRTTFSKRIKRWISSL